MTQTLPKGLAGVVIDTTKISSTKNAHLTYAATQLKNCNTRHLKKWSSCCGIPGYQNQMNWRLFANNS